jgi:flagellin-specific chaperone FliS
MEMLMEMTQNEAKQESEYMRNKRLEREQEARNKKYDKYGHLKASLDVADVVV